VSGRIIVLGAAGRLGRAAAEAFRDAGWSVASQVRASAAPRAAPGTEIVEVDARDAESLIEAARGADVVLHALGPPYTQWPKFALAQADAAIAAARAAGAMLMFPGNVYNYGPPIPPLIDETTPMQATTRKGRMRVEIEQRMQAAAQQGVRTIVLRAGDFYGGAGLGSWFDRVIVKEISGGTVTYPGALDVTHTWAYVPDLAAAMVRLADARETLGAFETFGFAGHTVTGRELIAAIARALGRSNLKVARMPWLMLRLLAPVVPIFRELSEVSYLWNQPHRIDGSKLAATIGEVPQTPFEAAVTAALDDLGLIKPRRSPRRV
jgi:nucleoside-diphosphate-sugar epimerase